MAYKCLYCEKTYENRGSRSRHTMNVHKINAKGETISGNAKSKNFTCKYCSKVFNNKSNCNKHMKVVHQSNSNGDSQKIKCQFCDKVFNTNYNYTRHTLAVHKIDLKVNSAKKIYSCILCDKNFESEGDLQNHIDDVHLSNLISLSTGEESDQASLEGSYRCSKCTASFTKKRILELHKQKLHCNSSRKWKCPLCPFISRHGANDIYYHFEKIHDVHIQKEHHIFNSREEFNIWKCEMEKTSLATYRQRVSKEYFVYYQCHRSGFYEPKGKGKRSLKMSGSCKINGYCPAKIIVKYKDGKVNVTHVSTHVGHNNEIKHKKLSFEDRLRLALQLANKKPTGTLMVHQVEEEHNYMKCNKINNETTINCDINEIVIDSDWNQLEILIEVSTQEEHNLAIEKKIAKVMEEAKSITDNIKTMEVASYFEKEITRIKTTIETMNGDSTYTPTLQAMGVLHHGNIDIVGQRNFFTSKKRKTTKRSNKILSAQE